MLPLFWGDLFLACFNLIFLNQVMMKAMSLARISTGIRAMKHFMEMKAMNLIQMNHLVHSAKTLALKILAIVMTQKTWILSSI